MRVMNKTKSFFLHFKGCFSLFLYWGQKPLDMQMKYAQPRGHDLVFAKHHNFVTAAGCDCIDFFA